MGLVEGNLVVQIHCGSRGFGHQVCTDYVQEFQAAVKRYDIHLPDRELVCAPLNSPEGQDLPCSDAQRCQLCVCQPRRCWRISPAKRSSRFWR